MVFLSDIFYYRGMKTIYLTIIGLALTALILLWAIYEGVFN